MSSIGIHFIRETNKKKNRGLMPKEGRNDSRTKLLSVENTNLRFYSKYDDITVLNHLHFIHTKPMQKNLLRSKKEQVSTAQRYISKK